MGVKIGGLITTARAISLTDLAGKVIGIDGYNVTYQFLAKIRKRGTGEPLRDEKGRVTSHLSGILYRVSNFIESGVRPLFVWDGTPSLLKKRTIEARRAVRENARKKWVKALERGEEAMVYAQASSRLTQNIVDESKYLLDLMGVPSIQAPSEGEAQLAVMSRRGDIWASASQDWDSLLFDSPRLVRNLSISGKRKLPGKAAYVEIKPEIIELSRVLKTLGITRDQLIILGILIGTDYNPGVKGIGPKTALQLVKDYPGPNEVSAKVKWNFEAEIEKLYNLFKCPPVTSDYEIKWKEPNTDKLIEFMFEEHSFSHKRVVKVAELLDKSFSSQGKKSRLDAFLG